MLACLAFSFHASAQRCGFDARNRALLATNPAYQQAVQDMNSKLAGLALGRNSALIVNTPGGGIAYQIPVVVHVIHTGGAIGSIYNPPDAQLIGMVDYLNQVYAANWPGYPAPGAGGTKIPLQFVLAKRDPNCNATTGIVRVDGSGVPNYAADGIDNGTGLGADEVTVKALSIWPRTEYYNIWVVNKISGEDGITPGPGGGSFVAGYAYFPTAPANVDGTIMLASTAVAGDVTLPHEVGHAFSVYHTFEGDDIAGGPPYTCPANANCSTDGDQVCDTDPHTRSPFNCPTGTNPCTGNPYGTVVRNIMDYSNCTDRFTPGQSARMIDALMTSRSGLISSQASLPLPTIVTACSPTTTAPPTSNSGPRRITVASGTTMLMDVTSGGYSADGNVVLLDRFCKHGIEVMAGSTYDMTVRTGFQQENVRVYVDYNNDGNFDPTELAGSSNGNQNNQTHQISYTVPTTASQPGLVSCVPLRMRIISDRTSAPIPTPCGVFSFGQAEDFAITIRGGGPTTGSVTVTQTSGGNPSCFNTSLSFSASAPSTITNPTFAWFINNTYTGVTGPTFSSSVFQNNDSVRVKIYFVGNCGLDTAISAPFIIKRAATVPPTVAIQVTGGNNPGCAGAPVTFTATPTNGGTASAYQWKVNGVNQGINNQNFTATLNNGDQVWVVLTSNSSCAAPTTATSNKDTIVHTTFNTSVTLSEVGSVMPACWGTPLTFAAVPSGSVQGSQLKWFVDGNQLAGANNDTLVYAQGLNGQQLSVVFLPNSACFTGLSDTASITIVAPPLDTPNVAISIIRGGNPGCFDSIQTFKAAIAGMGLNPSLQWFLNGVQVGIDTVFSSSTLDSGDVITFTASTTDGACYTQNVFNAAPITMSLFPTPIPPIISFIGNMLVANAVTDIIWFDTLGQIVGTGQSFHPDSAGLYYAVRNNQGCYSPPSNKLSVSLLDVPNYDLSQVQIHPNPTSGRLTLDWGAPQSRIKIDVYSVSGQGLLHDELVNASRKEVNLSHFTDGVYFMVLRDDAGRTGTMRIVVNR